jgi:hypothetical protein
MRQTLDGPFVAGQRTSYSAVAVLLASLYLGLPGSFPRVVNFDPRIPDGALAAVYSPSYRPRAARHEGLWNRLGSRR